jgi:hypothetical protein
MRLSVVFDKTSMLALTGARRPTRFRPPAYFAFGLPIWGLSVRVAGVVEEI